MAKTRTNLVINERDRTLFSYLYEVKVATSDQIMRDVFINVSKTVLYCRVKKYLLSGNVIRKGHFNGDKQIVTYSLSKKGLMTFILDKNDLHLIKSCQSEAVIHDLVLNDIRHLFINKKLTLNYLTENVLSSHSSIVGSKMYDEYRNCGSDAYVEVLINDKKFNFAIEYEHTLKYTNRYTDLFGRCYASFDIDGIFYIAKDKKVLANVQMVEKSVREEMRSKFYFALIDDLLSNPKELKFNSNKENLMLTIT